MAKHHGVIVTERKWYGYRRDARDARDHLFLSATDVATLPTLVDLRSDCPPVMDQGQLGSCTAHGITGILRYLLVRKGGPRDHRLSRLQLYYDERVVEGDPKEDAGAEIRDGIKCAASIGVSHETMWPYVISKFARQPTSRVYTDAAKFKALEYQRVTVGVIPLKQALADGHPVVVGFSVFESFESNEVAKTGVVPMPDLNSEQMLGGHCFHGSTEIPLLNGTTTTIEEIAKTGTPRWVYSIKEGHVVPGLMTHAWKSGSNRQCVKVMLDDGSSFVCTPDHRIMLRTGKYKQAGKLKPGTSLMPLYRGIDDYGYETVYDPANNVVRLTHRQIASVNGRYKGVIHHNDFNKRNNDPPNLIPMSWEDHTALHAANHELLRNYSQSPEGRETSRQLMTKLWADPEWSEAQREILRKRSQSKEMREKSAETFRKYQRDLKDGTKQVTSSQREARRANSLKILGDPSIMARRAAVQINKLKTDPEYAEQKRLIATANLDGYNQKLKTGVFEITEKQREARRENMRRLNAQRLNHKVVSVELAGSFDVYDAEVEQHHNFAIGAGVFVHNCVYVVGYGQYQGHFTCRNSWGAEWGDKGDFYMPEAYLGSTQYGGDYWIISGVTGTAVP